MTVDEKAEQLRALLGLNTWEEHARYAAERCRLVGLHGVPVDAGRRSGRTTRGLLHAIARCVLEGETTLHVCTSRAANDHYVVTLAKDMIAKLGLPLKVKLSAHKSRSTYVDHYWG